MRTAAHVSSYSTLLDLLEERAARLSEAPLFHFVEDSDGDNSTLSYAGLLQRSRAIGACLQQLVPPGERAVLLYPPGLEYVAGFFGCLYAGSSPSPPIRRIPSRLERTLPRLRAIIHDAQATVVLTTSFILSMARAASSSQAPDLKRAALGGHRRAPRRASRDWQRPAAGPRTRWPSSSTPRAPRAPPRAWMLTHANLLHNLRLIHARLRHARRTARASSGCRPTTTWGSSAASSAAALRRLLHRPACRR